MKIFKSRQFWAALIGILLLILQAFFPFLTDAQLTAFGAIIIAYIVGESLEGARPAIRTRFAGLFKSRKFWAAAAGLLAILCQAYIKNFPITADQMTNIAYVLVAVITGAGIEGAVVQAKAAKK